MASDRINKSPRLISPQKTRNSWCSPHAPHLRVIVAVGGIFPQFVLGRLKTGIEVSPSAPGKRRTDNSSVEPHGRRCMPPTNMEIFALHQNRLATARDETNRRAGGHPKWVEPLPARFERAGTTGNRHFKYSFYVRNATGDYPKRRFEAKALRIRLG